MITATNTLHDIQAKVEARERVSSDDALWLWKSATDADLRRLAMQVRERYHAPGTCSYIWYDIGCR